MRLMDSPSIHYGCVNFNNRGTPMKFAKLLSALLVLISLSFTMTACNDEGDKSGDSHGHSHD